MPFTLLKNRRWEEAEAAFAAALEADDSDWRAAAGMVLAQARCTDVEALAGAKTPLLG